MRFTIEIQTHKGENATASETVEVAAVRANTGWIKKFIRADHGILMNIILGIFGTFLMNAILIVVFGATLGGWLGQLIVAAIGASLMIWIYRTVKARV